MSDRRWSVRQKRMPVMVVERRGSWSWWITSALLTSLAISILVSVVYTLLRLRRLRQMIADGPRVTLHWINLLDHHVDVGIGDMIFLQRKNGKFTTSSLFDWFVSLPCARQWMAYDVSHVTVVVRVGHSPQDTLVVHLNFSGLQYITLHKLFEIYKHNHTIMVGKLNVPVEEPKMNALTERMKKANLRYRAREAAAALLLWRGSPEESSMPWHGLDHKNFTCASLVYMMYEQLGVIRPYQPGVHVHPNMLLPVDWLKPRDSPSNVIPWHASHFLERVYAHATGESALLST